MKILIIIPTYNAEQTIEQLLDEVEKYVSQENILVVNDGSIDSTIEKISKKNIAIIHHQKNLGKGAALQTGFDFALQKKYEAVITLDADLQHPPKYIPEFLQKYYDNNYDIIIGNRLHNTQGMPFHRKLSNTITTFLVKLKTGVNVFDSQSGYRFIHRKVLEKIHLSSSGFEAETELLLKAVKQKYTFGAVNIPTIYNGEKSNMKNFSTTINFIKILLKY